MGPRFFEAAEAGARWCGDLHSCTLPRLKQTVQYPMLAFIFLDKIAQTETSCGGFV